MTFKFYLGTHIPSWMNNDAFRNVPLFVTIGRLKRYTPKRSVTRFMVDSDGFTSLTKHGRYLMSARVYADYVSDWLAVNPIGDGTGLVGAAVQDWMCEPFALSKTGLTVAEHQGLTTKSYLTLRQIEPDVPWFPVLQGYTLEEYRTHAIALESAIGSRLDTLPVVGLGSICKRQGTSEAARIVHALAGDFGAKLHLFGFKSSGIPAVREVATSADSMAWSANAYRDSRRKPGLKCGGDPLHGRGINCANCKAWALKYYSNVMEDIGE